MIAMFDNDTVRAWKDADGHGDVPHPSGDIDLGGISGGAANSFETFNWGTFGCCNETFSLCSFFDHCPPILL